MTVHFLIGSGEDSVPMGLPEGGLQLAEQIDQSFGLA